MTDLVVVRPEGMTEEEARVMASYRTSGQSEMLAPARCMELRRQLGAMPSMTEMQATALFGAICALYPSDPLHTNDDEAMVRTFTRHCIETLRMLPVDLGQELLRRIKNEHDYRTVPNVPRLNNMVHKLLGERQVLVARLFLMAEQHTRDAKRRAEIEQREAVRGEIDAAGGPLEYMRQQCIREGREMPQILTILYSEKGS